MNAQQHHEIEQFLYRLSALCDARDWDAYLDQYDEGCEFHVPQWDSEHEYTTDPKRGMSLMYYANRSGLEDRVYRIRTGKSAASTPMPRTLHQINNVRTAPLPGGQWRVDANWSTFYHRFGVSEHLFGQATYHLRPAGADWKITRKHVVLMNDTINAVLDFYHL